MSGHEPAAHHEDEAAKKRRAERLPGTAAGSAYGPSAQWLRHLQRTAGNTAVNALLRQYRVQRQEEDRAPEAGPEGGPISRDLSERINAKRGGGSGLAAGLRERMEGTFGTAFDDVRVHSDGESHALNRSVSARAFTTGRDVFLGPDASTSDTGLMAHELTHVVQQRGASPDGALTVGPAGDGHEQEAETMGGLADRAGGGEVQGMAGGGAVHRLVSTGAAAPPAPLVQRTPIQRDSPPAPAAPGNPVLHGLFQTSVAAPIDQASKLLRQPKPDAKGAGAQLQTADNASLGMISPLRDLGNELAAEGTAVLMNRIQVMEEELQPHIAAPLTLPQIAADLEKIDARVARVDSEIAAAKPDSSAIHAQYLTLIVSPIQKAKALLHQRHPDAKGAGAQLQDAKNIAQAMITLLKARKNEVAAEGTAALGASMDITAEQLRPHISARLTLPEIAADIDLLDPRIARVDSLISATAPPTSPAPTSAAPK